jgi:hypothetical protein
MVDFKTVLKGIGTATAVTAATLTGGPAAGASMAAFLASPPGQKVLDVSIEASARANGVVLEDLARGGLITRPTLGLTGEAGPEFVMPLSMIPQKKRKASAYSKRYGRAFKKVQGQYKLKSGAWAKNGFKRAQKAAHALAKKK